MSRSRQIGPQQQLTEQFYVALRSAFERVRKGARAAQAPDVVTRIEALFAKEAWRGAYEIEQLMIELFDDVALESNLAGRLVEAAGVIRKDRADKYVAEAAAAVGNAPKQRAILARLVDDLQWQYTKGEVRRELERKVTQQTNWAFVLCMVAIGVLLLLREFGAFRAPDLLFASAAGAWGASFSMLSSLRDRLQQSSLDALKGMRLWVFTGSRIFLGLGAGAALYMLLVSNLLAGGGFPDVGAALVDSTRQRAVVVATAEAAITSAQRDSAAAKVAIDALADELARDGDRTKALRAACDRFAAAVLPADATADARRTFSAELRAEIDNALTALGDGLHLPRKELMLLVVWCVIAGFSEKFVPNLLAAKEKAATPAS